MPVTEYNFPEQIRNHPLQAGYYTSNTIQTYDYQGYPNDARGDNWD